MSFLDDVEVPKNLQEPQFNFLVENLFSKLDGVSKDNLGRFKNITSKKVYIIENFIKQFKIHIGNDIYPSSRLIFPNKDRRLYFIKDFTLARLIIKIFDIPKNSNDYDVLFNWKKNYHKLKYLGNDRKQLKSLPLIISRIISNRRIFNPSENRKLTVAEINSSLDKLTQSLKTDELIEILRPILLTLSIEESRWFLTILLKISILNIFEPIFFEKWHPDGMKLFQICNDLSKIFRYLTDPTKRLAEGQLTIVPMLPFLPQLSQKLLINYNELCIKMKTKFQMNDELTALFNDLNLNNKFLIEEKMDGDRMILHMKDFKFKFFSRKLKDYTLLYGENLQIGSLTKYLSDAFKPGVKSIVLDGEMVAWDFERNAILPFGTLKTTAIQEAVKQFTTTDQYKVLSSYPFFIIFDILHLNGKNLTNLPLFYRKNLLNKIINPVPNRFEILKTKFASSPNDIKAAIKDIVCQRSEGIMVKHLQSKYHINTRSHNWVKIKPEYLEQFGENLDLVVIGKEPGIKNSYMLGLKDENDVFKSFCMVANGFSNADYDKIERITNNKWYSFEKFKPPSNLQFGTKKPTYWINSKHSVVLEIKARSIDSSSEKTYAVGTTLHNLYCRSIRDDKLIDDCITLEEYKQLKLKYSKDFKKSQSINKKRRTIEDSFYNFNNREPSIKVESNLFENIKFLILSDKIDENGDRISINNLKQLVGKFGGHLIQSPFIRTNKQILIVSEFLLPKCEMYLNNGFDIIKPNWIFECIKRNAIIQLEPLFIFKTKNSNFLNSSIIDKFGDSWIIHNKDIHSLYIPHKLNSETYYEFKNEFIKDLNALQIPVPLKFLFDSIKFFIIEIELYSIIANNIKDKIRRFGGEISNNFNNCSFIIIPNEFDINLKLRPLALSEVNKITQYITNRLNFDEENNLNSKIPNVVVENFIDESVKFNTLVDANDFKFA